MVTLTRKHTLVALCVVLMTAVLVPAQRNPIKKDNLLRSLRVRGLTASAYSDLIRKHRVDFKLTADDERQIRRAGKYLGKKGLDQIIAAIRDSYIFSAGIVDPNRGPEMNRPVYQRPQLPSPSPHVGTASNFSNVPARQNFLIETFNVKVSIVLKREANLEIQGLQETSASLSMGGEDFKMIMDANIAVDSTDSDKSVVTMRYLFDSPNPLVGKPIFLLTMVETLTIDYSKIFRSEKLATTNVTSAFVLSLIINRKEYVLETPTVTQQMLASGELSFDVQKALTGVVDEWIKTNIRKVTITSISPNRVERSRGMVPVTIRGDGFQRGLLLFLICKNGPAQTISPGQLVKISPTEVIGMLNNYSGFVGSCHLSVQNPDGGRSNGVDVTLLP